MFLIDIFAEIVKQQPDSKLLLVGDGDEKEKIQEKNRETTTAEKCFVVGCSIGRK